MASFSVLGFLIFCTLFGSEFRTSGDRLCTSQVIEENIFLLRTFASVCDVLGK
jgi:hypothetical protein